MIDKLILKFKIVLMKYQKERLVLIISIICSIFLSTFLWKHISFPYSDPKIIGVYSLSNHDAKNDIFRYFSFIGLPLITYLAIKFIYNSNFLQKIKVFLKKDNSNVSTSKDVFVVFLIILTFLFFDFLSINFPEHKIDSYHDGQRLSSAYKSLIDGSLWSGSYVTVGIFYETLATKFIWQIFQNMWQRPGLTLWGWRRRHLGKMQRRKDKGASGRRCGDAVAQ